MPEYPDRHTVGARLRWARERSGLTQEHWAKELGVSVEQFQEWELSEATWAGEKR